MPYRCTDIDRQTRGAQERKTAGLMDTEDDRQTQQLLTNYVRNLDLSWYALCRSDKPDMEKKMSFLFNDAAIKLCVDTVFHPVSAS